MFERILIFLVSTGADILSFLFIARLLMQLMRVSFANPIGEFVIDASNWAVRPLRRILPPVMRLDTASLLPAWVAQMLPLMLLASLRGGVGVVLGGSAMLSILWVAAINTLIVAVWVMVIALIASAIISWVNPYTPFAAPLAQLTRPLLRPVQRVVPPIGRFDLSILVVVIALQVVLIVLDSLRGM